MRCQKCGHENSDKVQFCRRCHHPIRYKCPACHHFQDHGVQCDHCGVDFEKFAAMLVFQTQTQEQLSRQKSLRRSSIIKQVLLLPVTGGLSLFSLLRALKKQD